MSGGHRFPTVFDVPPETLAAAIARVGNPVDLLRNAATPAHTFPIAPEFTNWRSEQRAWARTCALLDQSHHMTDLFIEGPDALRLLSDLGVNTFTNFEVNRAKQYVAVNADGYLIGDAILFHLEDELYDLVGHPMVVDWVQFHLDAGDYKAVAERDDNSAVRSGPPKLYRYELQGPTAAAVIEQATGAPLPATKFFDMAEFTIAGRRVRGLRHGMAGQPGFELFGPWADGEAVLATLLEAGADHGLVRAGAKAYSTANLESGWVPAPLPAIFTEDDPQLRAYREWLPATAVGSLGGSVDASDIAIYYLTPYDIGYARNIRFDHDFVGRAALERMAAQPPRRKVTLVWNPDDVAAAIGSLFAPGPGAKHIELPKARYALHQQDKVLSGDDQVGVSLDCGYIANERAMVSLATVDVAHSTPGTEVVVLWGEEPTSAKPQVEDHRLWKIRATVAPVPYVQFARDEYRGK
jgi:vanillate/3-O-methylgallate O-demethylase